MSQGQIAPFKGKGWRKELVKGDAIVRSRARS